MSNFTLQELQSFDAVVCEGGFQAGATRLHRSHSAVFAAVAKLEARVGIALLDRSGYRVVPTEAGRSFHAKVRHLLANAAALDMHARQLASGEETQLRVILGDTCPTEQGLELLGGFFAQQPDTRLDLHYETISGPQERLLEGEADLVLHWVDKADARFEWIDLGTVAFVPVVAPGFLPFDITPSIAPEQMRSLTQCIIRDTARGPDRPSFHVLDDAPQCTVADHRMKKEVILRGLAWGHLPAFMIAAELERGLLMSMAGTHFPGVSVDLVAARRRDRPHGPVACRLWHHIAQRAHAFALKPDGSRRESR
ncbi:MAG: LysR family transcriptional regulator [Sphingomonas sp.]|uniref:LysR family transcriptional regulator n=1 Tax=Sphingomonas sp. TaxID=28214 RepID=UPI001B01D77F|nr:LysR family transcriptional regulator [Sphingomonas sp.]MBO9621579.1 LysR family transcriptional regulator [Sphingomonas sp.]